MNKTLQITLALVLLSAASGAIACDYPERADVPDGATATKEEMINGQSAVKSFMTAMEEYLSCIEAEEAAAVLALGDDVDEETTRRRNEIFNEKYNGAVEEMNRVAEEFNIQVRAYKARDN